MKITLSEASVLQHEILSTMSNVDIDPHNTCENENTVAKDIEDATAEWENNIVRKNALVDVLYSIRQSVGELKATSGINTLLTEKEKLRARIDILEEMVSKTPFRKRTVKHLPVSQIVDRIKKLKENPSTENRFGYRYSEDGVEISLITPQQEEEYKKIIRKLERKKRSISDQVRKLNVENTITLSEADVKVLTDEDLI